jgi:hypothetical protein
LVYSGITQLPTITNNQDGTVTVSSASVNLFPNPDGSGNVQSFPIPAATFTPATGSTVSNYLTAYYNNGSPIYQLSVNNPSNGLNYVGVAIINAREDGPSNWDVDYFIGTTTGLALANKILNKDIKIYGFIRETGFSMYETGSRGVAISDGVTWRGVTRTASTNAIYNLSGPTASLCSPWGLTPTGFTMSFCNANAALVKADPMSGSVIVYSYNP